VWWPNTHDGVEGNIYAGHSACIPNNALEVMKQDVVRRHVQVLQASWRWWWSDISIPSYLMSQLSSTSRSPTSAPSLALGFPSGGWGLPSLQLQPPLSRYGFPLEGEALPLRMCTPMPGNPCSHCTTANVLLISFYCKTYLDVLHCRLCNPTTTTSFPQASRHQHWLHDMHGQPRWILDMWHPSSQV
jgi:hypothetical protein